MHTLFTSTLFTTVIMLLFSCGGDSSSSTQANDSAGDSTEVASLAETAVSTTKEAISLWGKVGLRDAPGSKAKYLTTIFFGEKVDMLGESQEIESEKRTYIKVGLSDGKEGWVNEYLFATNAQLAVAANEIDIYKRPDLMTASGKKLKRGEIVAFMDSDKAGWLEIIGEERKKAGWVQNNNSLSSDPVDVTVAVLVQKAMKEGSPEQKEAALKIISENSTYQNSIFIDLVESSLAEISALSNLRDDQLSISADQVNVRDLPSVDESKVVFQLNEGDVCTVLRRTDEKMEIKDMNDYWYKIDYNGETGWVYGHHTSKKGGS